MGFAAWLVLMYTILVTAVCCAPGLGSSGNDGASDVVTGLEDSRSTGTSNSEAIYLDLLSQIPDTPEMRNEVHINNWAMMRETYDVDVPAPGYSASDVFKYFEDVAMRMPRGGTEPITSGPGAHVVGSPWITGFYRLSSEEVLEYHRHLGFDGIGMDQTVLAGTGISFVEIGKGRVDPAVTQKGIAECSNCPEYSDEEYSGVPYYSWVANRLISGARRPGNLLVEDGYVYHTFAEDGMNIVIDTKQGRSPSLADVADFSLVVDAMSEMDVFSMLISSDTAETPISYDSVRELLAESGLDLDPLVPLLQPYRVFAVGNGFDGVEYMVIAIVFPDADSASENKGLFIARVQEYYDGYVRGISAEDFMDEWEFKVDGRVLVARLDYEPVSLKWLGRSWPPMEALLWHE